ncbi:MAG: response regulator, partial [Verrucomicrobiota bacterium]
DRETLIWLAVLLRHAGYETVAAEDGAMAMTMAIKQRPDAIILDIGLPAGNGMFVLENVRKHIDVCMVPVIVLTGGDDFSEYELIGAGATYFFRKPTENEVLLNAIEATIKI